MKKLLKEFRKGEEDNILPFDAIPKPDRQPPGGPDWLSQLKVNDRFIARKKNQPRQVYLELFGIGYITPAGSVMLAYESEYGPQMQMKYVNSANFSQLYELVEVLPILVPHEDGEGNENGSNHHPP